MKENEPKFFKVLDLLRNGSYYSIPMYQRNYAWGEGEIQQLIQDITDCYLRNESRYYIGTLVVSKRSENKFEVVDGQQRLATLALLVCYVKNKTDYDAEWLETFALNVSYASRKYSNQIFDAILRGNDLTRFFDDEKQNRALLDGYGHIKEIFEKIRDSGTKEKNIELSGLFDYLFEKVWVIRVEVPGDADLHQYFEIMNNRGEQLEKHEILKSRMIKELDQEKRDCMALIWEACENMEKYIQIGFSKEQCHDVFGRDSWDSLDANNFLDLCNALKVSKGEYSGNSKGCTIDEIIRNENKGNENKQNEQDDEDVGRFSSVVNFSNFLLHVLRIQTKKDVSLDDKNLIPEFEKEIFDTENATQRGKKIEDFVFALFKCKFLYDKYVIKRDFSINNRDDNWSLKRLKWNTENNCVSYVNTFDDKSDNRKILMLLSAFHVSTPARVYKHWLSASLYYLFYYDGQIESDAYLRHLESIAKGFVFDRFLSERRLDYFEIIFDKSDKCEARRSSITKEEIESKLSFGKIENNFVFNYLEYLLWKKYKNKDPEIDKFRFTFRSSIEHYYPQQHSGLPPLHPTTERHKELLHSFGNLHLISHSENSRLGNKSPDQKKFEHQQKHKQYKRIDCVKLYKMMEFEGHWWEGNKIEQHSKQMIDVLLREL